MNSFFSNYGLLILIVGGYIAFRLYRKGKGHSGHMGCGMPGHMGGHGESHDDHESQPTRSDRDATRPSVLEPDPVGHRRSAVGETSATPPARPRGGC